LSPSAENIRLGHPPFYYVIQHNIRHVAVLPSPMLNLHPMGYFEMVIGWKSGRWYPIFYKYHLTQSIRVPFPRCFQSMEPP